MDIAGGNFGNTVIELDIDGNSIVQTTIEVLKSSGFTQNNPLGYMVLESGGFTTLVIGFQQPIEFKDSLVLRARVRVAGINQIVAEVIHGK